MNVHHSDVVYRVWWDHREAPKVTVCWIKRGQADFTQADWDAAPCVEGRALLNSRDRYRRNSGRKIALAKALKHIPRLWFVEASEEEWRAERTRFWQAYREQLGHW